MRIICVMTLIFTVISGIGPNLGDALHASDFIITSSVSRDASQLAENPEKETGTLSVEKSAEKIRLQVDAGAYDRLGTIVSVQLPVAVDPGVYPLADEQGEVVALQVDDTNKGWFVLKELPAGTSAHFTLNLQFMDEAGDLSAGSRSGVHEQMDSATITYSTENGKVLSYYHSDNDPPDVLDDRFRRGGYIHPIYSPSGVILSNHLNIDNQPHHSGIWSAWTNTRFENRDPDFWNVHNETGRVDVDSLLHTWVGAVFGGFRSSHRFTDLSAEEPIVALNETWEVHVYTSSVNEEVHIFDLKVTQTVNTDRPLYLPEYRYGGIGFRGHKDWDDPEKGFFLTPDGLGRDGHATRARWAHMGGYSDGELAGFAILSHPSNYRFPQPMRIHPSAPFFNYAPTQLGDMSIQPGIPYVTRYRIITHDGGPDADLIDRLWQDYAYPPSVTISM